MIYNSFKSLMHGILLTYGNSIERMVVDQTDKLFGLIKQTNGLETVKISPHDVMKNTSKFQLVRYDYNGNLMWCPLFALEYKVIGNKVVLYAVQLEYIPPRVKMQLFSTVMDFVGVRSTAQENNSKNNVTTESPLPVDAESIYNILKTNGLSYSLTGFDVSKIREAHVISTKVAPLILSCDCKRLNSKGMRELLANSPPDYSYRDEIKKVIEGYEKLIDGYDAESLEYHKKVRGYENNLKLFA